MTRPTKGIKALIEVHEESEKHTPGIYQPYGGAKDVFLSRDPEVMLHGPAGTGKSMACLMKLHWIAAQYPGSRSAIVRKVRKAATQAALVTFEQRIRQGKNDGIDFRVTEQEYRYPNGSVIVVAGLDDESKVMSTEFDCIYVQEATELYERDWDALLTRLRWAVVPYQQLLGDCNPSTQQHWIMKRSKRGGLRMIKSNHQDNPMLWDREHQEWTEFGRSYMERLDRLADIDRRRLKDGEWIAPEGMIYTDFNVDMHLVQRSIPEDWEKIISIDFGFTNPFVAQWWAKDGDGRMYLYRELYGTRRLVEDWAHDIYTLSRDERIKAIVCDHDAEGRATLERHLGHDETGCYAGHETNFKNVRLIPRSTLPADKNVRDGIEGVKSRLKLAGDMNPRIFFLKDALVERDSYLEMNDKPTSTIEEIESYVWDKIESGRLGERLLEQPKKVNDHGMDAMRYAVRYMDTGAGSTAASELDALWGMNMKHTMKGRRFWS
jgi:PBSX family phage terminase large subunit